MDRSGRRLEKLVHKMDFVCHAALCQAAMAAADHPPHLEAFGSGGGCCHPLEAAGGLDHALERTVVRLNHLAEMTVERGVAVDPSTIFDL